MCIIHEHGAAPDLRPLQLQLQRLVLRAQRLDVGLLLNQVLREGPQTRLELHLCNNETCVIAARYLNSGLHYGSDHLQNAH